MKEGQDGRSCFVPSGLRGDLSLVRPLSFSYVMLSAVLLFAIGIRAQAGPPPQPSPSIVRGFMIPDEAAAEIFPAAKSWGANVVRYQIDPPNFAEERKQTVMEAWPALLEQTVAVVRGAGKVGLKIVVDVHNLPLDRVDRSMVTTWAKPELEKNFVRVWSDLARALKPYREAVWGYDLYNEPVERSKLEEDGWEPKAWRPLALKLTAAIRAVDPEVWIIYEPGAWAAPEAFEKLEPLPDARVIYSVHFYQPELFTHQGVRDVEGLSYEEARKKVQFTYPGKIGDERWDKKRLAEVLAPVDAFQARYQVPIYVGEFSAVRWAPKGSGARWLQDVVDLFEARHWSWTYHALREWSGWDLEHDDQFWMNGMELPKPPAAETDRAKVIRHALALNGRGKAK